MLVKFKSKAAADVLMYEEHAKQILDLLGKDTKQGIITAEENSQAIAAIEAEIERQKAQDSVDADANGNSSSQDDDDEQQAAPQPVKFSTRVYPLLEMLRAAQKGNYPVVWGV